MADRDDSADKPFDPTPRKLEEARKRGEVPLSQDLLTAAVYLGMLVALGVFGMSAIAASGQALARLLADPDRLSAAAFGAGAGAGLSGALLVAVLGPLASWFLVPGAFALLAAIAQNALVFAPVKLKPRLSRVSPVAIARQKFGREGLFNFAKSFLKLLTYSAALALVGAAWTDRILATPRAPVSATLVLAVQVSFQFLATALAIMVAIGAADYFWQRAQHLRKNRMSLKEMRDELKDSEGDPQMKQERRQRGHDIATNRMLADVPSADVVIVNPAHYAVALRWSRDRGTAPVCVAKGVDEVAARIRAAAMRHGVPLRRDPATARALYATVELGREIRPEHYRAVAAAIRFADAVRARAGRRR